MNDCDLRNEFYDRTKRYNFSEDIEGALMADYLVNFYLYTDRVLNEIRLRCLVGLDASSEELLTQVRIIYNRGKER